MSAVRDMGKPLIDAGSIATMHRKYFKKADRNHDGRVSLDEMRSSGAFTRMNLAHTPKEEEDVFKSIDANHDNFLSDSESLAFFSRLLSQNPEALIGMIAMTAGEPDEDEPAAKDAAKADAEKKVQEKSEDGDDQDVKAKDVTPAPHAAVSSAHNLYRQAQNTALGHAIDAMIA